MLRRYAVTSFCLMPLRYRRQHTLMPSRAAGFTRDSRYTLVSYYAFAAADDALFTPLNEKVRMRVARGRILLMKDKDDNDYARTRRAAASDDTTARCALRARYYGTDAAQRHDVAIFFRRRTRVMLCRY